MILEELLGNYPSRTPILSKVTTNQLHKNKKRIIHETCQETQYMSKGVRLDAMFTTRLLCPPKPKGSKRQNLKNEFILSN